MTVKVKFKGDKIKVQAGEGYCPNVKDLLILTDNGNGYFVKRRMVTMGIDISAKLIYGAPYSDLPEEILEEVY